MKDCKTSQSAINNCLEYNSVTSTQCTKCKVNYILSEDKTSCDYSGVADCIET